MAATVTACPQAEAVVGGHGVVGRAYLEAFVGNCPPRVVRAKKPPDEVSMQSSGKALHERDSGHGPIHREPWLLSLHCMEELALEKALGDIFPPFHRMCSWSCWE